MCPAGSDGRPPVGAHAGEAAIWEKITGLYPDIPHVRELGEAMEQHLRRREQALREAEEEFAASLRDGGLRRPKARPRPSSSVRDGGERAMSNWENTRGLNRSRSPPLARPKPSSAPHLARGGGDPLPPCLRPWWDRPVGDVLSMPVTPGQALPKAPTTTTCPAAPILQGGDRPGGLPVTPLVPHRPPLHGEGLPVALRTVPANVTLDPGVTSDNTCSGDEDAVLPVAPSLAEHLGALPPGDPILPAPAVSHLPDLLPDLPPRAGREHLPEPHASSQAAGSGGPRETEVPRPPPPSGCEDPAVPYPPHGCEDPTVPHLLPPDAGPERPGAPEVLHLHLPPPSGCGNTAVPHPPLPGSETSHPAEPHLPPRDGTAGGDEREEDDDGPHEATAD